MSQYPVVTITCIDMAMPFNMILILCVIPCKLSCDFSKITILYIYIHIFYHFETNKSIMTFLCVNKISVCLSVMSLSRSHPTTIMSNSDIHIF